MPVRTRARHPKATAARPPKAEAFPIERILDTLDRAFPDHPMADLTAGRPYWVLIACLLSLRTKDEVSIPKSRILLERAPTPEAMLSLTPEEIQKIVFPVGFYRNKSHTILDVTRELLARYGGAVPDTVEELLTLKGVGRKTANLVVGLGHDKPAVCVDVHVHRITNRLGWLQTATPEDTEMAIRERLDSAYWRVVNRVFVRHGQEICRPVGPRCDICPVAPDCQKIDVRPRALPRKTTPGREQM